MTKKINLWKVAVSLVAATLLFQLYLLIFSFSEQDAETSSGISYMVSKKCVEIVDVLTGRNWSENIKAGWAGYFENPIRKLAHFSEYACMGMLLYGIWRPWKKGSVGRYLFTIFLVLISAAGDEFHQLFVPGRSGNLPDVLLDTFGGGFGLLCCICMERIFVRIRDRRKNKEEAIKKETIL